MSWIAENSWRNDATASFVRFWLSKQFLAYSFSFAVGIFVANLTLHADHLARRRNPFHAPLVFIIGALLTAFSMHWLGLRSLQNSFFDGIVLIETTSFESLAFYYLEGISMALGFGLILYGLIVSSEERWTVPFRFSALRVIGILGYGIYLWHMPFLYLYTKLPFLGRMSLMQHWFVLMLMTAIPVLAVSIFSFFAIERPAQNLGRRISQRRIS
jgi:peptidoglycan/LPS O-acetylase OafA/YrhL